jgi:hypothetical protein
LQLEGPATVVDLSAIPMELNLTGGSGTVLTVNAPLVLMSETGLSARGLDGGFITGTTTGGSGEQIHVGSVVGATIAKPGDNNLPAGDSDLPDGTKMPLASAEDYNFQAAGGASVAGTWGIASQNYTWDANVYSTNKDGWKR